MLRRIQEYSIVTVFLFTGVMVLPLLVQAQPIPPLKLSAGWYCGAADSFFDSDGERFDQEGFKATEAMFFGKVSYKFATLNADTRPINLNAMARISVSRRTVEFSKGEFSDKQTGTGLGVLSLGLSGKTQVSEKLNVGLGVTGLIDMGSEPSDGDLAVTDDVHAAAITARLRYNISDNASSGLRLGHVNRFEEGFSSRNYLALGARFQVWENDSVKLSVGAQIDYLSKTDDAGKLLGVAPIFVADFNDHLSLKLANGCTQDYVPQGLYQISGESETAFNSLGITVSKRL